MTKEEFLQLQELQRNSGLPLMKYLDKIGLKYSTYTYWMLTMDAFQQKLENHRQNFRLIENERLTLKFPDEVPPDEGHPSI